LFISALADGKSRKFSDFVYQIVEAVEDRFVVKDEFRGLVEVENEIGGENESLVEGEVEFCGREELPRLATPSTPSEEGEFKKRYEDVVFEDGREKKYFYSVSELAFASKNGYFKTEADEIDFDGEKDKINNLDFGNFVHEFLEQIFVETLHATSLPECQKYDVEKIRKFEAWLAKLDFESVKKNILYVEKNFVWKVGDIFVRGTIDRIDKIEDKKVRIIDYKTSEKIKVGEYDFAMNIYASALEEIFGLEVVEMKLLYPLIDQELLIERMRISEVKEKIRSLNCDLCD
jgi:hypothetical protein